MPGHPRDLDLHVQCPEDLTAQIATLPGTEGRFIRVLGQRKLTPGFLTHFFCVVGSCNPDFEELLPGCAVYDICLEHQAPLFVRAGRRVGIVKESTSPLS